MAQIGNKNAEKWTEKTVMEVLESCLKECQEDKVYSLAHLMNSCNLYPDWWADMTNKFKNNSTVYRAIKKVENAIENNILKNTMDGTAKSAAFSIFLLKNKFGYVDKVQQDLDHTTNGKDISLRNLIDFEKTESDTE